MSNFLDRINQQRDTTGIPMGVPIGQVLNPLGYDPSAGDRPMQDMPTRSSYDRGLMEGESVNDHREQEQGAWALAGAYVGRSLGQGAAKILEGFSMLGSAVGAGVLWGINATGLDKAVSGKELDSNDWTMDAIMNNPVNKLFIDFEEGVKNTMPVYHRDDYAQKSESDKFFHNFGQWLADEGSEMTSFALGLIVPSAAVSDIGVGASMLGNATRGATALGRTLSAMGASEKLLAGAAKGADLATQYAVHGSIESMFMAKSTGDQFYQEYLNKVNQSLPPGQQPYKDIKELPDNLKQDAANKASSAMKNDYYWNLTAGAPAALFEMGLINKFIGKGGKTIARGIGKEVNVGEAITDEASIVAKEAFQGFGPGKFKGLTRTLANASRAVGDTRVGSILKAMPKAVLIEGAYKMNLQHQLQEMSVQYGLEGKSGYFLESGLDAGKEILESVAPANWNNPKYQGARDAMFSGAVLGAVMSGFTAGTVGHNRAKNAKVERASAIKNAVDYLNTAKSDFISQDMYVTKDVTNPDGSITKQIQFDKDGQPIQDRAGMVNFVGNQKRMSDLVGTEEYYVGAGDKQMASIVRDERTTNWALAHLQSGKGDAMFSKLDKLSSARPEDLQKLGFDPTFYNDEGHSVPITERAEQLRRKASQVKAHYEEVASKIPADQVGRIEEIVRLKSRLDSMNDQVDKLSKQRDEVSLEYKNDPQHVKDIDSETRRLRALEDNHEYIKSRRDELDERIKQHEDNTKGIDESHLSKEEKEALKDVKKAHELDKSKLDFMSKIHEDNIATSKSKIDAAKNTYAQALTDAGHDATIGKYNLLKKSKSKGQSQDIMDSERRIAQLDGAIQEHGHEINELMKPFDGAVRYRARLASTFHSQIANATIEANDNKQTELPPSEFDTKQPAPQAAIGEDGKLYTQQQLPITPETINTTPEELANKSFELNDDAGATNHKKEVLDSTTTDGKLDNTKLDKFVHDNLGKQLKVTYEGNDAGVFGTIRLGSDGQPVFMTQGGKELPITSLLGSGVKEIINVTRQQAVVTKTEQAPIPKQSPIVIKSNQVEFDNEMYNPSKPYLSVGLNSTTGVDSHTDQAQERWFRASENLNLSEGKHQLLTITKANTEAAKKLLGADWNDDLHYDDNTIKVVLLKDGKPVKADQFGKEDNTGELVYTALRLTPSKDKVGIVEHRNALDKATDEKIDQSTKEYNHQSDKRIAFIATKREVLDGTIDKLLSQHSEWRKEILADPNTRILDITSKGSGIRVKGQLGAVQGRLTEGQTVDVQIAKGGSISDPSGKQITVKPGLAYTDYKGMVVPLTGRTLSKSERPVIKEMLSQWSQAESHRTLARFTRELSEAIDRGDKAAVLDNQQKLKGKDLSFLPTDAKKLLKAKPESYSADELQKHYDFEQDLQSKTTDYKQYLKDTIRLGDTDEHGIYMDKGQLVFGKESIPQEQLWSGDTVALDKFLDDKYLQISSGALSKSDKFTEYYSDNGELKPREWNNYNEYLTSNEYPNEDSRPESEIPLRSSLAPMGEAQFNSVNLRFNGFTEATKPVRTDTKAFNEVPKEKVRKEIPFEKVAEQANTMQEGKTYRIELRYRDAKIGQEPFYIDYKVQDGKREFVQITKRDGSVSNVEPKSFEIVRTELNDIEGSINVRPNDLPYEYMGVKELVDETPKSTTESVEPSIESIISEDTSTYDKVVAALDGEFIGSRVELQDFIDTILDTYPDTKIETIADAYSRTNPADVVSRSMASKIAGIPKRRSFKGMTADGRISKPIDIVAEEKWFKERFPNVEFKRTAGLIEGKYWGLFDSAAGVLVSTDAIEGTTYHEAFHTASLLYHDDITRQGVYKEYRDRTNTHHLTDNQIEEKLADEFRDFVLSNGEYKFPDKQLSFFRRIWEAIKTFFAGGNHIEDVFDKINNGGYANMKQAKDLGIRASAPMTADLAETYSKGRAITDDMTVSFFNHFFQDGNNIDTLFNVFSAGKTSIAVDDIYSKIFNEYKERAEDNPLIKSAVSDEGTWAQKVKIHKEELANLGLKLIDKPVSDNTGGEITLAPDLEVEGQKDNAQMESYIEFSSKEGMPKIVKFFLSSLPELEQTPDGLSHVPSAYFTDKLANPEKLMNVLGNRLSGITDIGDMVNKIKELSSDYPTLTALIKRMQIGDEILPVTATHNEAQFQTMFWQQFAKTIREQTITFIADDGSVRLIDANSETQQYVSKQGWRNNLLQELDAKDSVIKIDDKNRIILDKNKVQQLKAIEDPFKRAEKLGIKFTFPEKIKSDPEMMKTFTTNLDALVNSILATGQPVTDLYTREGFNSQNRIKNISDLEAKTAPDSIERQFMAIDGRTNYSLGQFNALSIGINELNNRIGTYHNTIATNPYSQNSVVKSKLEDPTYKIDVNISAGVKRQTGEAIETGKLTPADAMANTINGILGGQYSALRPGDKKLEYKLGFGEFVPARGLVREGNYNAKVNKIFRGYLADEFNRVISLKNGLGDNIAEYNKHILKNGKTDLGFFNDILKDVNIPNLRTIEEVNSWIDENKDTIDAKVKDFLEATTNQYGAKARKLSVFKETMEKVGNRKYKATGQYIINGVSDEVVNRVLGRDTDSDRYSKGDVHQFFRYITVNQLIGNIEQTKLTTGAIEFYKDPLKRFSSLTGTRKMTRTDTSYEAWAQSNMPKEGYIGTKKIKLPQDGKIRIASIDDVISDSPKEVLDNYKEGLKANGLSDSEISDVLKKFKNINEADAQSWMHLPAYRELLHRTGDWTNAHENAYSKAIKGEALTAKEIFLFPPLKPLAYGPQDAGGLFSPLLVKTSISPLIPFVVKGTDLEKLMHKMYNDGVDMTSPKSAVKVGGKIDKATGDFMPLYIKDGDNAIINPKSFNEVGVEGNDTVVSTLPYQYMGIQLDVAPKRKTTTTRGTQHEKLIMSNIKNIEGHEQIVADYKKTINGLVQHAKNRLLDETGIKAKGDNYVIPDRGKLLSYLTTEAIKRDAPTNMLVGLQKALLGGSSLDAVVNKDRIDSILSALVTNGVIKGTRNGEQRVQVAATGYGTRTFDKGSNNLRTSDKLKSYVYDPTGTKPMEIMTALPKALVPFVEKVGGLQKFNEMIADGKIDERILRGIGFRIPTQQLSSMVHYKIKEFLPYESGPVVVLPSMITSIAGSDFDIDKLSLYEKNYNINYEKGGVKDDFRPNLRKELTKAGLLDQFKTVNEKLPEELTDEEIGNLVQYSKDTISDEEGDRMDDIIVDMQRKYTTKPTLEYIESGGDTEKALQNRLLEINEQVMSHPSNFKNLIAPIGNEVLSGLADRMVELRAKAKKGDFNSFEDNEVNSYASTDMMNMDYLMEQGQRFQSGKDMLGIAAKQNTHHTISQMQDLALKPDVKVWFREAKNARLRMDNITDLSGKHQISDVISEFINGFVDIVKNQFTYDLNTTKETINPLFYLTRVGVPIESVTTFLNQPVIRKYINERGVQGSLIAKGLPDIYQKSNYETIDGLREELHSITKQDPSLYAKANAFRGQMPHYYQDESARAKVRDTYRNFSNSDLEKMILDPNKPEYALGQLQVLDQFLQYQDDSNQMTDLMMLTSADTDGVKSSLSRSYVQRAMYKEFMADHSTIFENPEKVVDGIIRPYHDIVMEAEKYFAPLYESKSEQSDKLRHELVHQLLPLGIDGATDTMKKFENHLIAHLLQNVVTESFPTALSEEAIKAKTTKSGDTVTVQPPLLLGKDSAVNSLMKLRKNMEYPNDFVSSLFATRGVDRTPGNYIDNVRLFNKRINKQQTDLLSGAATDLLNDNPALAKRVFRATLVQSGLNNSYMSYHNVLPAEWYHNFVSSVLGVYREGSVHTQNIIDDFYRNNWKNEDLVPTIKGRRTLQTETTMGDGIVSMDIMNPQYNDRLYIKRWSLPTDSQTGVEMTRKKFFELRADETLDPSDKPQWDLQLYKHYDNDGERIFFKRVNPLGLSERYQETSLSWKDKSMLNQNNKVSGDYVSSEEYNNFTGYKPDLGKLDPNNVPVSDELKERLTTAAGTEFTSTHEAIAAQDRVDNAIRLYQQKVAEGMDEKQAAERAEHEITCI